MSETPDQSPSRSPIFFVSVYLDDRAYGGPEEGGWWYDCGDPSQSHIHMTRVFRSRPAAKRYRDKLQQRLDQDDNKGRRSIHSVLSEGVYRAHIDTGRFPASYPATRPHYE